MLSNSVIRSYREGHHGGKEARSNIMMDSADDADLYQREDQKSPQELQEFLAWQQDLESDAKNLAQARPTVFRWAGAAKDVFVSGSFNNWSTKIPLNKSFIKAKLFIYLFTFDHSFPDLSSSPPGPYLQDAYVTKPDDKLKHPPFLPPHLLQVLLNKDTGISCDPTLLPEPNHVMLNHLYALSIKDGVMVLSATHRYKKKYVTTLLYKPV
ncbi:5'-AMP-activated protein kinase subunit beta-1b [Neolamprologus brichardi]|uniref:5'-AMP-activated protein kinase subunit beta-1b n=1 Tax=Neolamprologus brichardi TaxID=32507 RepID=UPI001643D38A|nr:5'-AMP-activated protein kinase subunit beta-1b [Neolamprologus brichardi]